MVSRTKKATKSGSLDGSEHSAGFHLEPLTRKGSSKALISTSSTHDNLDSKDFSAFRSKTTTTKSKKKKGKKPAEDDSDSDDSDFGGGGDDSSSSSSSSSSSDSENDSDGGFSVLSNKSASFRINGSSGTPMTTTNPYGPATGRLRQAAMNRRGSTSVISKSEMHLQPAVSGSAPTAFSKGVLNRRGSTSMIPKIDNSSAHGSNRSLGMVDKQRKKKKEGTTSGSTASTSVNSTSVESATSTTEGTTEGGEKKKKRSDGLKRSGSKRDGLERTSSKRMGDKAMSTTSLSSTGAGGTSALKTKSKKSSTSSSSSKKKKEDIPEDEPSKAADVAGVDEIQAKFMESRRKERAARLEAAKERIRLEKEAAKKKKKKDGDSDDDESDQDEQPASPTKSPRKKLNSSSSSSKPKNKAAAVVVIPPEERLKMAYRWYMRLGMPNQEKLKERVRKMGAGCEIKEEDVDLLPWIADGRRVNVKQMLMGTV